MRAVGLLLSLLVVAGILYPDTLRELLSAVLRREESSHGVFVPLLSLYFIWRKRNRLSKIEPSYDIIPGLGLVAGGLFLFSLVRAYDSFFWECFSFVIVISGFVTCFWGKDILKEILFPVLFLAAMIPIPGHLYNSMADWVREGAIRGATHILSLVGVPFLREDLLIHLPNTALNINIGCSGIRYLVSYFVFGVAYAYLYRTTTGQRVVLVGLTIPISLIASTLRLTTIATLAYYIGPYMATHWPHVFTSWLVFLSVLGFFVILDQGILLSLAKRHPGEIVA